MGLVERRKIQIGVNIICFVVVFMTTAVILLRPLDAVHRGFFCDDRSIRYPYKHETISNTFLIFTCTAPSAVLIPVLEVLYGIMASRARSTKDTTMNGDEKRGRMDGAKMGLTRAVVLLVYLCYGNFVCKCVTEAFKLTFGQLRPSFLDACQPETDLTSFANCTGLYVEPEDLVCTNPDKSLVREMRKSFVSGHASFAAYNMLFFILYLQRRLPTSTPRMAVSLFQALAVSYAVFVMTTRIVENYHYLQDIIWGVALGVIMCWLNFFKLLPRYSRHPPRTEVDLLPFSMSATTTTKPGKQGTQSTIVSLQSKE